MDWYGVSGRKIRNGYLSESNSGGSFTGKTKRREGKLLDSIQPFKRISAT